MCTLKTALLVFIIVFLGTFIFNFLFDTVVRDREGLVSGPAPAPAAVVAKGSPAPTAAVVAKGSPAPAPMGLSPSPSTAVVVPAATKATASNQVASVTGSVVQKTQD